MASKSEIIYGTHAVRHALQHRPEAILEIWIMDGKAGGHEIEQIIRLSESASSRVQYVPKSTLDRLSDNAVHQGVVIKCRSANNDLPSDIDAVLDGVGQWASQSLGQEEDEQARRHAEEAEDEDGEPGRSHLPIPSLS